MVHRVLLAFFVIVCACLTMPADSAQGPAWANRKYYVLEDGNELYSECQSLSKTMRVGENQNLTTLPNATRAEIMQAGACWGYVKAVVDSIPDNEDFHPDSDVRISQYVDIVVAYLPSVRHYGAYVLVRTALSREFPAMPAKGKQ